MLIFFCVKENVFAFTDLLLCESECVRVYLLDGDGGDPVTGSAYRTEAACKKRHIDYRARCAISSTKNVRPGWGMLSTAGFSAIGSE